MRHTIAGFYGDLKRRYSVKAILCMVLLMHTLWIVVPPFFDITTFSRVVEPHKSDFMSFWCAARFALEGAALDAYQSDLMKQAQAVILGYDDPFGILDWLFPPQAFFVFMPFGVFGYTAARFLWIGATLLCYAVAAWKLSPNRMAFVAALAAPALAHNA
ncbi:MAG: DUF2029 domain-containing protein, partial [Methylobacteriaceae bacterium]|nr:DUF2029 domain-containing protein [Methylobacteriaceae bacterium]